MKAFKQYGWVVQWVGAALLVGLALFLEIGDGVRIVVPFIGALIVISAMFRLVPYVKTQKSDLIKTINIIEITVDVALGLALILLPLLTEINFDDSPLFGILIGLYLMIRGAVHFYGVSERKETSDLPLYLFHVAALIVGSFIFFNNSNFTAAVLIHIILAFSIVAGGYLTWGGYKGYKAYRYQKTLMMPDSATAEEPTVEKKVPVTDQPEEEERIQDHVA